MIMRQNDYYKNSAWLLATSVRRIIVDRPELGEAEVVALNNFWRLLSVNSYVSRDPEDAVGVAFDKAFSRFGFDQNTWASSGLVDFMKNKLSAIAHPGNWDKINSIERLGMVAFLDALMEALKT